MENKIQELKNQIKQLEKEGSKKLLEKYQYLIGKCIHQAHTSYHKIISIDDVCMYEDSDLISYTCINVYFDNRGDEYNFDSKIDAESFGDIYSTEIERCIISEEKFKEVFENCVNVIRNKINI